MQPNFRMLFPIPAGLAAECIVDSGDAIEVTARAEARVVRCPFCGPPSHPVPRRARAARWRRFRFVRYRSRSKIRSGRRSPRPRHVLGYTRLPDIDAQLEQFAVRCC